MLYSHTGNQCSLEKGLNLGLETGKDVYEPSVKELEDLRSNVDISKLTYQKKKVTQKRAESI